MNDNLTWNLECVVCELGYIYISISSNHKCCIEGGLINFNYKRNLAFRIILAFFPSLVTNVLRHNHLVEPGVEGRKVTSHRVTGSSWCSTTLRLPLEISPLVGTCPQNPCTFCAPFPSWPLPTPTNAFSIHQVAWPLAPPHLHHSRVVLVLPKSWAQLVTCQSPFGMGWTRLRSVPSCCNKTRLTPIDPPNLVDPPPHNSSRIVGSPSSPSRFVHRFGGGMKCSSWVPTPFASTRPAKTYL